MNAKKSRHARYFAGTECPHCGNAELDKIEDNGCTGARADFHCRKCDEQWSAEQFR